MAEGRERQSLLGYNATSGKPWIPAEFLRQLSPYTNEFEQMYNIIKEEFGEVDDTITIGRTFNTLKEYHQVVQG